MPWMKNQPWRVDPEDDVFRDRVEWNLWKIRQPPFNDLEEGDPVFLACRDDQGRSQVWCEVEVTKVMTCRYESKAEAWWS